LNNKAVIHAQQIMFIEADLLFVEARTVTLNWKIPIGVSRFGIFGLFRHHNNVAALFWVTE
jgi:glycosylphosphatidylinositol transamidase (GPIT) subunit GPI8